MYAQTVDGNLKLFNELNFRVTLDSSPNLLSLGKLVKKKVMPI